MEINWQGVGSAMVGLVMGLGGGIAWWQRRHANAARLEVEVARAGAERSAANAEHALYAMLSKRLAEVEFDMKGLRAELAEERTRGRDLETHIFRLENMMRAAGMEPPVRAHVLGGQH